MKKLLIGVTGIGNSVTRKFSAQVAEEFNIEHINMRAPLLKMIGALHGVDSTHVEHNMPGATTLPTLKASNYDLEITLAYTLRALNKDFFINEVAQCMQRSLHTINRELFSGHLITGITSQHDAQWLRNQGGLLLHVYNYDSKTPVTQLNEMPGDIPVVIDNTANAAQITRTAIATIHSALQLKKAA